ncbi:DUF2341 domain-containing protein, partial [archaeon]|nr:DUF2341 domain-containing protein [archaeon]
VRADGSNPMEIILDGNSLSLTGTTTDVFFVDSVDSDTFGLGLTQRGDASNTAGEFETSLLWVMDDVKTLNYTTTIHKNLNNPTANGTDAFYLDVADDFAGYSAISDSLGNVSKFSRRKSITLNHSGALTDYQTKLTIAYESEMLSNFDDIHFVTDSGAHIPYWIENKTDGVTAEVWIKSNLTDGNTNIWMYYGNAGLSSGSDIVNTMIFGDDFSGSSLNTNNWDVLAYGGFTSVANGLLTISGGVEGQYTGIKGKIPIDQNSIFESYYYTGGDVIGVFGLSNTPTSPVDSLTIYERDNNYASSISGLYSNNEGSVTSSGYIGSSPTHLLNQWKNFKIIWTLTQGIFKNNDNTIFTANSNIPDEALYAYLSIESFYDTHQFDYIFVRKYTATEPTYIVGAEQTPAQTSIISKDGAYSIGANTTHVFASINDQTITASINAGWNHITLTYDKNAGGTEEMKLYIDGVSSVTGDYNTSILTNANDVLIGDTLIGNIDEVRIYNKTLTPIEIADTFEYATLSTTTENPKASINDNVNVSYSGMLTNGATTTINIDSDNFTVGTNNITIYLDAGVVDYSIDMNGLSAIISNTGMNNVTVKGVVAFKTDGSNCVLKSDETTFDVGDVFSVSGCPMSCDEFTSIKAYTDCTGVFGEFTGTPSGC